MRAGKFFARSQANLDGTSPGRSVEFADGAGKQGKRPARRPPIVPPRGEPVKVKAGRKFFRQGRPEEDGGILPASRKNPAFYSGDKVAGFVHNAQGN